MEIFFTASKSLSVKYQDVYDHIVHTVKDLGNSIISLEVMRHEDLLGKSYVSKYPKNQVHYDFLKKGMNKSNAVIIEASVNSFRLGHEATMALLYNKPVLCLSDVKDYSESIPHSKFYSETYESHSDITNIIKSFLKEVKDRHLSLRKNFYMTPSHANFLDWVSRKQGQNASEIIRKLIESQMKEYPDYDMYSSFNEVD